MPPTYQADPPHAELACGGEDQSRKASEGARSAPSVDVDEEGPRGAVLI
ncbi:hypothetical protein [Steroidobacter sp.]|nr:hypothetical protein [Steroidobacter sp.]